MIIILEGLGVGAGKSFTCCTWLIAHFCKGGTAYVVETMQLKWDNLKEYVYQRYGYILQDDQYRSVPEDKIATIHEHTAPGTPECPVVIVLDEAQGELNSRDWNDQRRRALFKWACQSRHDDNDLWFLSQSSHNIDKQIRRIATFTYRVRNSRNWGFNIITCWLKCLRVLTFGIHSGAYFFLRQYDADGKTSVAPMKWIEQDPDIFKCYESKAMRGKHQRLMGEVVHKRQLERRKMKTPYFRWAIALCVVAVGVVGCQKFFSAGKDRTNGQEVAKEVVAGPLAAPAPSPASNRRVEKFRGQMGTDVLVTDKWLYRVGELTDIGRVDAILEGQVRIKKDDGHFFFVITDRRVDPQPGRISQAAATPARSSTIVVARDPNRDSPVTDGKSGDRAGSQK